MKIDISDLLKYKVPMIELDFSEDSSIYNSYLRDSEIILTDNVRFKGTLLNNEGILILKGTLSFEYKAKCSRCLKEEIINRNISVDESVMNPEHIDTSDSEYFYEGNYIELERILKDEILLNISIKHLCKESCKGLCPVCGADMNEANCSCKTNEIDPRLEVLKSLLENKD